MIWAAVFLLLLGLIYLSKLDADRGVAIRKVNERIARLHLMLEEHEKWTELNLRAVGIAPSAQLRVAPESFELDGAGGPPVEPDEEVFQHLSMGTRRPSRYSAQLEASSRRERANEKRKG